MNHERFDLIRFPGPDPLAEAAAKDFWKVVDSPREPGEKFSVAVSGGRIAHNFFKAIVSSGKDHRPSLNSVHFFWADERCVPPNDPDSNYGIAHQLLLAPLAVPADHVHRIRGEDPPATGAALAEAEISRVVPPNDHRQPVLDLIILGLGENGHTASLFPEETEEQSASPGIYRAVVCSKPPPNRVTLGYPAIAAAREVWMLASGTGKEAALAESLKPGGRTPFARVLRQRTSTRILTDIRVSA